MANSQPSLRRRLKLGFVGGGRGALVGEWHAMGVRMSNCWEIVAGALASNPEKALASGQDWMLPEDRVYTDYQTMAEQEAARDDRVDAIAICTPNHTHKDIAAAFLEKGISVICDKPMTATWEDAEELVELAQKSSAFFAVSYTYWFHSMARQAAAMIQHGQIGKVRQAHVEYVQDWASGANEQETKQSGWRRDPAQSGRTSVTGDIGTHAFHLLASVTGLAIKQVSARFFVCGGARHMEDTALMHLTFDSGAPGTLWCTQAAPGNACGLRFRIYGDQGGLEWDQENPEILRFTPLGEPTQLITRGHGAGMWPEAERMVRLPRGHSEGVPDAWCNFYTDCAHAIIAHKQGLAIGHAVPDIIDGARGVFFAEAAADSHEADGAWMPCWFDG